jgi:hypothetical protein
MGTTLCMICSLNCKDRQIRVLWFLPLSVASCCPSIQLVLYDAVNRNKVSIQLLLFIFLLTHYMFRPLRAILRWDIQLDFYKDYSYYNGSAVRTQLDVCLYRYFDPWSPIHVIKPSIKVVKTLKFTVKLDLYIKYKNVKISRWMGVHIFLWWSGRSSNLLAC